MDNGDDPPPPPAAPFPPAAWRRPTAPTPAVVAAGGLDVNTASPPAPRVAALATPNVCPGQAAHRGGSPSLPDPAPPTTVVRRASPGPSDHHGPPPGPPIEHDDDDPFGFGGNMDSDDDTAPPADHGAPTTASALPWVTLPPAPADPAPLTTVARQVSPKPPTPPGPVPGLPPGPGRAAPGRSGGHAQAASGAHASLPSRWPTKAAPAAPPLTGQSGATTAAPGRPSWPLPSARGSLAAHTTSFSSSPHSVPQRPDPRRVCPAPAALAPPRGSSPRSVPPAPSPPARAHGTAAPLAPAEVSGPIARPPLRPRRSPASRGPSLGPQLARAPANGFPHPPSSVRPPAPGDLHAPAHTPAPQPHSGAAVTDRRTALTTFLRTRPTTGSNGPASERSPPASARNRGLSPGAVTRRTALLESSMRVLHARAEALSRLATTLLQTHSSQLAQTQHSQQRVSQATLSPPSGRTQPTAQHVLRAVLARTGRPPPT